MFAKVIIDVSSAELDRAFTYRIPAELMENIEVGTIVEIPFGKGNRPTKGFVVELTDHSDYDPALIKDISAVSTSLVGAEEQLVALAKWMGEEYGSTFLQALKTVIPVKTKVTPVERVTYTCQLTGPELTERINTCRRRHYTAKLKVYEAFFANPVITSEILSHSMGIEAAVMKPLVEKGEFTTEKERIFRTMALSTILDGRDKRNQLNDLQQSVLDGILGRMREGDLRPSYIHGITASGKTEVYMHLAEEVLARGQQVIMLIPEISLTFQTVMRFYGRFQGRVSFINSRLSKGERYDQYVQAREGKIDIMIGPRSALFTPFQNLGLIIMDEEHDQAYRSEQTPRYSAREVAEKRAKDLGALLVMGSATPSLSAYHNCSTGKYELYEMNRKAVEGSVPSEVSIIDMRDELHRGNRSMFSGLLQIRMQEALNAGQQIMLFYNRRGYAGFVSCRSCGFVFKCPHCDISLTAHRNGKLLCHYCGYEIPIPDTCPECGFPHISGFGAGTEKVEAAVHKAFPGVRTLIMDRDSTSRKNSMEAILKAFADHEADVLIGTQMIVKGHDFPDVTVMGILAADMSLFVSDYRSGEQTFSLLTQAAGRAGRGEHPGSVVIQTYDPDHYVIRSAAAQDYAGFYAQEAAYRRSRMYPPFGTLLEIIVLSEDPSQVLDAVRIITGFLEQNITRDESLLSLDNAPRGFQKADGKNQKNDDKAMRNLMKRKDVYRSSIYLKTVVRERAVELRSALCDSLMESRALGKNVYLQFDLQS
ncbi:MAG: primosomal protein N' [Lachnospiraceae bacterium]|nr:primosomal protein N' [Lachnospiraceae bacterium]